jgi:hypothetical protein
MLLGLNKREYANSKCVAKLDLTMAARSPQPLTLKITEKYRGYASRVFHESSQTLTYTNVEFEGTKFKLQYFN